MRELTLGDIKNALDDLVAQGAHLGAIHFILTDKMDHDCGDCDLCDCLEKSQ